MLLSILPLLVVNVNAEAEAEFRGKGLAKDFGSTAFQDFQDRVSILCKDRPSDEYFRLTTEGDCRDVVRCDRAGIAGKIRLAKVKCPTGLAFDLERQTCDWRSKVFNCDTLSKPQIAKPNLYTIEPVCPDDQIQCGSGECILRSLFCDKTPIVRMVAMKMFVVAMKIPIRLMSVILQNVSCPIASVQQMEQVPLVLKLAFWKLPVFQ